jgi:predicted acylesterase/phospholipase RssA/CRP-like cAMP-binding protein
MPTHNHFNPSSEHDILRVFQSAPLFQGLGQGILELLAAEADWVGLESGDFLFKKGDPSDAMYLAVTAGLAVWIEQEVVVGSADTKEAGEESVITMTEADGTTLVAKEIDQGETIGEMQFLTSGKRTANVSALQDTNVVRVRYDALEFLGDQKMVFLEHLSRIVRKRLQFNQLATILPKLFGVLTADELEDIVERADWFEVQRGETLFSQGDVGDSFYILLSGRLGIAVVGEGGERKLVSEVMAGEILGEMALLTEESRSATVYAIRNSNLFRLSKSEFDRLLEKYPKFLSQINRVLIERLRVSIGSKRKTEPTSVIAIVPTSPNTATEDFARHLSQALLASYATLSVNSKQVDALLNAPNISQVSETDPNAIRIATWFSAQELAYPFILLVADSQLTHWTRWCVRHADHVLILGEDDASANLGEIEDGLLFHDKTFTPDFFSLVLVHSDPETKPVSTQKWLKERTVAMVHHVRRHAPQDFQRLARYLTGQSVGLVLSGGGARGFAHLGAIRALQENGVPIDMIAGTSFGSIVSGLFAMGWSLEKITHEFRFDRSDLLKDITLPMASLFSGKKMAKAFRGFFGDTRIEDLWIPFFCVSSNLTRAEIKVHQSGAMWQSIQASNAAPGIFPPVVLNGDLHVDGALLSNLPADIMSQYCKGTVISVDVSPAVDLAENADYGDGLSGWDILWRKLNPFSSPISVPSLLSILHRSGELASVANQKEIAERVSDLYLRMPVEKYNLQEYDLSQEIAETGYHYAQIKIAEWLRDSPPSWLK